MWMSIRFRFCERCISNAGGWPGEANLTTDKQGMQGMNGMFPDRAPMRGDFRRWMPDCFPGDRIL